MSSNAPDSQEPQSGLHKLCGMSGWLAGGLSLIMMIAILREVIGRYFFNTPSDWSLELSGYLLVALTYLGAPYTEMAEGNIRIDFLYSRFSPKLRAWADVFICLVAMCWTGMLMWQGWLLALDSWEIGACSSEAMAWPLFPSQVLIPIGAFLLILILIFKMLRQLRFLFSGEKR
jgi:TRAP-type C4-dicarboxylate transport system permease small subunit